MEQLLLMQSESIKEFSGIKTLILQMEGNKVFLSSNKKKKKRGATTANDFIKGLSGEIAVRGVP